MKHIVKKSQGNFLHVITPEFIKYVRINGETAPLFHYVQAVSYARTRFTPYGDSFWVVPGTLNVGE
jgi:hypothetical protein